MVFSDTGSGLLTDDVTVDRNSRLGRSSGTGDALSPLIQPQTPEMTGQEFRETMAKSISKEDKTEEDKQQLKMQKNLAKQLQMTRNLKFLIAMFIFEKQDTRMK